MKFWAVVHTAQEAWHGEFMECAVRGAWCVVQYCTMVGYFQGQGFQPPVVMDLILWTFPFSATREVDAFRYQLCALHGLQASLCLLTELGIPPAI